MPIYEYECQTCHRHTEKRQKFSDPEITTCPHCGGPLQRVISAPAFAFAGGGWYKDLYSSNKPSAVSGGEGKSDAAASGTSEGTGDSKPASASADSKPASGGADSKAATSTAAAAPASAPASSEKK